jgi:hypothetical protein
MDKHSLFLKTKTTLEEIQQKITDKPDKLEIRSKELARQKISLSTAVLTLKNDYNEHIKPSKPSILATFIDNIYQYIWGTPLFNKTQKSVHKIYNLFPAKRPTIETPQVTNARRPKTV